MTRTGLDLARVTLDTARNPGGTRGCIGEWLSARDETIYDPPTGSLNLTVGRHTGGLLRCGAA